MTYNYRQKGEIFMQALQTLAPILFMAGLGWLSRTRHWITQEQKEGANQIVFGLLFPVMVFNLLASSTLAPSIGGIVLLVLVCYCLFYLTGRALLQKWFAPYSGIAPFLLTTAEGGNFALPLFLSIVGTQSPNAGDPMLLDLAGVAFCFLIIPLLVARQKDMNVHAGDMVKQMLKTPMVIAAFSGLLVNVTGLYAWAQAAPWFGVYSQVMAMVTAPIIPMILYIIGYNLEFSTRILQPAAKLVAVRLLFFAGILGLLYLLFPAAMADPAFAAAAWLYFMGPVGFGVIVQISPLMSSENDRSYCSGVISLNMIVTLIVYIVLVMVMG
ncbi:AEC family transporter [Faecalibaculum rodentium]|uniref:AEC family transporter n=2 Tax=Faecalibaculum rodentium TaxID=1702221 RepID=UPI001C3DFF9B|nr:AEC family transporter [Faecalibaculum rodentium]